MHAALQKPRVQSAEEARESPNRFSFTVTSSSPALHIFLLCPVRFSASLSYFASSTLLLAELTAGEGDKEATVMKSFRDLQNTAPVPS